MFTAELNFVWIQHELFVCRYLFLGYEDYIIFTVIMVLSQSVPKCSGLALSWTDDTHN